MPIVGMIDIPKPPGVEVTYRDFVDRLKSDARSVATIFNTPQDDWAPYAFFDTPTTTAILPLLSAGPDQSKWGTVICAVAAATCSTKVGTIMSAWTIVGDDFEEVIKQAGKLDQHPDRMECVIVMVYDAERIEMWQAKILRDGEQPPVLAEWVEWPNATECVQSDFVDEIREVLR